MCILLLSGCNVAQTTSNEQRADYVLDDNLLMDATNTKKKGSDEKNKVTDMQKVLENEYLELYLGKQYDIAVYNKATGKVICSNPVFHESTQEEQNALMDDTKKLLFSQVSIEYYDANQKRLTMTSYPDSYSQDKNQVTYEVVDDSLVVKYALGTNYADSGLVQTFSNETFTKYNDMLQKMVDSKQISIIDYRAFVNNYTKLTYSEMKEADKAMYLERYPNIKELGTFYVIKPKLTNKITNQLLKMYTLLGINQEVVKAEQEKMGMVDGAGMPAYFVIPIRYRLQGNDLIVSVDTKSIQASQGYYLTKVELLKSFAATTPEQEGYIFLPDGSGSIIENDSVSNSMDKVSIPFYGQDYAKMYQSSAEIAINSTFPVFGIKGDDSAVFAIVENGSGIGGVCAQITSNYLNYNIVYPYFDYTAVDHFDREGVTYAFSATVPDVDYGIRYHFLSDEDANYSAMARYYRQYLEKKADITKKENKESHLPIDVQFIGSISKTVNYLGIPYEKDYAVTTFEDADTITQQLKDSQVDNIDLLYSGIINGGMNFKAVSKVKIQQELGGEKGFKALQSKLEQKGNALYTDIDFTRIFEKGNGITQNEEVSKYLNKNTVYVSQSNPSTGMKSYQGASYLVNPLLYDQQVALFMKAFEKVGSKNLYLSSMGAYLNGNYSAKFGVTRQTSLMLTQALLQKLKDNGYKMKLDCGNDYVLPYADSLTNIATTSSHQRIESYAIPFVAMVLKGYIPYTSQAINQATNSEKAILESVESGAGLNYLLMYEDQLTLSDTQYTSLFSIHYNLWLDEIIKTYHKINADLGYLSNVSIQQHQHITQEVNCVVYEDGSKVYVNYGSSDYRTPYGIVPAMSYLVAH